MIGTAVVVDDHPMCRHTTRFALEAAHPGMLVREAGTFAEAKEQAGTATLMTLDLSLPDSHGPLGIADMLQRHAALRLLVISGSVNPEVEQNVAAIGAHGFLSKAAPISEMIDALRAGGAGRQWFSSAFEHRADSEFARLHSLTGAQRRILEAMAGGRLNKQIAHDVGLSEITVKAHVKAVLRKLAVPNRTQAILMLQRAQS